MAFRSPLLLITLLSIISMQSSSAQNLSLNTTLAGVVTCPYTSLATAKTFPVISLAKVEVVCGLLFQRVIKSTRTNIAGIYSVSFTPAEILFNIPELCHLKVAIPPTSCAIGLPGGALRFPIIAIRSGLGIGPVIAYVPGAPSYVPPLLN